MKNKNKNTSSSGSRKNVGKTDSLSSTKTAKNSKDKGKVQMPVMKEPNQPYTISSRIRSIGNSKGVILSNRLIQEAGIAPDADLIIQATNGMILIAAVNSRSTVNTDLSSWDADFKNAIKKGNRPEADEWEGLQNRFDKEEWT